MILNLVCKLGKEAIVRNVKKIYLKKRIYVKIAKTIKSRKTKTGFAKLQGQCINVGFDGCIIGKWIWLVGLTFGLKDFNVGESG